MKTIKKKSAYQKDRHRTAEPSARFFSPGHGLYLALIVLLGILAYSNTFDAPFLFDDNAFILNDPAVQDLKYFSDSTLVDQGIEDRKLDINFRTRVVPFFSFALNYQIGKFNVTGYHLVNLFIHIVNGLLVYWFVLLTFRTPFFGRGGEVLPPWGSALAACFASLMFISHPVQIQAVTYVSQRFASLATSFYLLSMTLYIRARLAAVEQEKTLSGKAARPFLQPQCIVPYGIALLSAFLAMHSKEISFTLPLMITLYEFLFFEGEKRKRILYVLPLLLTMLVIPLSILGHRTAHGELENLAKTIHGGGSESPVLTYLYTQFRVVVTYLRLFVLPVNQNLDYDYPRYTSFFQPEVYLSFLFLLFLFTAAIVFYRRSGRAGSRDGQLLRLAAFGIIWFFLALSVESSILPLTDLIFEHRMYLPSVGVFLAVIAAIGMAWRRTAPEKTRIILVLVAVVIGVWSAMTYLRNDVWTDKAAIWEDTVRKSPGKGHPHNNLGWAYLEAGRIKEAIRELESAIRITPLYADAYRNLGVVYMQQGDYDAAVKAFQRAIAIKDDNAGVHSNLAVVYERMNRIKDAENEHLRAISMNKDVASVLSKLGLNYLKQNQPEDALVWLKEAARINPRSANFQYNLGIALEKKGDLSGAMSAYEKTLKLDPQNPQAGEKLRRLRIQKNELIK